MLAQRIGQAGEARHLSHRFRLEEYLAEDEVGGQELTEGLVQELEGRRARRPGHWAIRPADCGTRG